MCGACAGLAPDLDIFIASSEDPLLFLTYHRQFTHSLIFIPIGALIVASFLWVLIRSRLSFKQVYLACLLGYATHGLLDSCTSYGTQLFWPFTDYRVAWNTISIIDPLFTLPLLASVIVGIWVKKKWLSTTAFIWALIYLSFGFIQNHRAEAALQQLALSQGHEPTLLSVKASTANVLLWKGIYEHDEEFYTYAIRTGLFSRPLVCGKPTRTAKLDLKADYPWLGESQQLTDVGRFMWFSQNYVGIDETNPNRIIDIRYSVIPNQVDGFWGIELNENASPTAHVRYSANERVTAGATEALWHYIRGEGCEAIEQVKVSSN